MVVALAVSVGLLARAMTASPQTVTVPAAAPASARGPSPAATVVGPRRSRSSAPGSLPTGGGTSDTAAGVLVIDVEGKVRRPGLVRLPGGSRVADAIVAAGGPAPGAALMRINLARPLSDGEQVIAPGPSDPLPATDSSGSGSAAGTTGGTGPLDLNSATQVQFEALPGVGPVLAGRIIEWRSSHGRFTGVDELGEVTGIGDKLLERLRPLVRV